MKIALAVVLSLLALRGVFPTESPGPASAPSASDVHGAHVAVLQSGTAPLMADRVNMGVGFLRHHYNPELGLLYEAEKVAPHTYWLANDNALSAHTLARLGEQELSRTLFASLRHYKYPDNDFIEVAWGKPVPWPPKTPTAITFMVAGEDKILQEDHAGGATFEDWRDYSNLAMMGTLNQLHTGHRRDALATYKQAMQAFDGEGFRDKAFTGTYETYKLAWAILAAKELGEPVDPRLTPALLWMQGKEGGFYTHYGSAHAAVGDQNVETTSLALLALSWPLVSEKPCSTCHATGSDYYGK
jgi:hypothetical protein